MQVIYQTWWPMQRFEIGLAAACAQRFSQTQAFNFLLFKGDKAGVGKSEKTGGNWIRALGHWLLRFDGKKERKNG